MYQPFKTTGVRARTLIICLSPQHARYVAEAFEIHGDYTESWMPALCGAGYDKIIVFHPNNAGWSETQTRKYLEWRDLLSTHLYPKGKIVHV